MIAKQQIINKFKKTQNDRTFNKIFLEHFVWCRTACDDMMTSNIYSTSQSARKFQNSNLKFFFSKFTPKTSIFKSLNIYQYVRFALGIIRALSHFSNSFNSSLSPIWSTEAWLSTFVVALKTPLFRIWSFICRICSSFMCWKNVRK